MMSELQKISKLSLLKEEDNIIRDIIRGKPRTKVLLELQKRHPSEDIIKRDLDDFLYLYKDIFMDEAKKLQTAYGRRMIKQQEGLTNELVDLALKTKQLVNKFDEEGDNTNTVGALRVAADIFMKVGKVNGVFEEKPEVNINMQMDKLIVEATTKDSDFKKSLRRVIDIPSEDITEDG